MDRNGTIEVVPDTGLDAGTNTNGTQTPTNGTFNVIANATSAASSDLRNQSLAEFVESLLNSTYTITSDASSNVSVALTSEIPTSEAIIV